MIGALSSGLGAQLPKSRISAAPRLWNDSDGRSACGRVGLMPRSSRLAVAYRDASLEISGPP